MSKEPERFFFNKHNFDNGHLKHEDLHPELYEEEEQEDIEDIPPPPTFSEEELEQAKQQSFQEGLQQGKEEQRQQHNQEKKEILEKITELLPALTQQENDRITTYEQHAIALSHSILTKIFPHIADTSGFDEITQTIKTTLKKHERAAGLIIYLNPDRIKDIQTELTNHQIDNILTFKSDTNLGNADVRIVWDNGGAMHSPGDIANSIFDILTKNLPTEMPQTPENTANKSNNTVIEDSPPPPECDTLSEDTNENPTLPSENSDSEDKNTDDTKDDGETS